MPDNRELDVELDVCEEPEQNFPRRPNIVSHRGHQLRINVTITQVPSDAAFVTIAADVFAFGPERIGQEAHVSRSRKLWGNEPGITFKIDPDPVSLPAKFTLVISEFDGDDHLGQGPYEALVSVNPTTDSPEERAKAAEEGDEFSIAFTSM